MIYNPVLPFIHESQTHAKNQSFHVRKHKKNWVINHRGTVLDSLFFSVLHLVLLLSWIGNWKNILGRLVRVHGVGPVQKSLNVLNKPLPSPSHIIVNRWLIDFRGSDTKVIELGQELLKSNQSEITSEFLNRSVFQEKKRFVIDWICFEWELST